MQLQFLFSQLRHAYGYGESARAFIAALAHNGFEVFIVSDAPGTIDVPGVIMRPAIDRAIPIVHYTFHHSSYAIAPDQMTIVRTMIEQDRPHPNWLAKLQQADALWLPSLCNINAFNQGGIARHRLALIHDAVALADYGLSSPLPLPTAKSFRFLTIFRSFTLYRKGIDVLLKAYFAAFSSRDDVALVVRSDLTLAQLLHACRIQPAPQQPEIVMLSDYLSSENMQRLYQACHAYVLPSRGEGIGRPYLYAMLHGLPVIATGWGGPTEYMNAGNAFLLKWRLRQAPCAVAKVWHPYLFGSRLAEPDLADLSAVMRRVFSDRGVARAIGLCGQKTVAERFNPRRIAAETAAACAALPPARKNRPILKLFDLLYPLHFPGERGAQLLENHLRLRRKSVQRIAIYGTGAGGQLALQAIQALSKAEVVFLDRTVSSESHLGFPLYHYRDSGWHDADLVVIATAAVFLPDILKNLKKRARMPIYYF